MDLKNIFTSEQRKALVEEIKEYFLNEHDIELGDLACTLLLDFFPRRSVPSSTTKVYSIATSISRTP